MTTDAQPNAEGAEAVKQRPSADQVFWVLSKDCRCLAYRDKNGNWINFYTGKKLADFVRVIN
jgi:hypothetical protein